MPLSEETNINLLEKVVADQRQILMDVFNESDVSAIPQIWALCECYLCSINSLVSRSDGRGDKEGQGYYEDGMRVPDDVTLLWSDDKYVISMLYGRDF